MKKEDEKIIKRIVKKYPKINSVHLFGSALNRKTNKFSDIDICFIGGVGFEDKIKIMGEFSENYDISFFEDLPIWIKKRVLSEGKIIYVKNLDKLYDENFEVVREYEDFSKIIKGRIIKNFGKC